MRVSLLFPVGLLACLWIPVGHPSPVQPTRTQPAGEDLSWVRCGGPPGGLGYDVRMSPEDPGLMFVTDAFSGVFRSEDGGATWAASNTGINTRVGFSADAIPVFSLTIDPNDPNIVWVGTQNSRGIFRSTDAGRSWTPKVNGIVEIEGISFRGFAVEPGDSATVYAAAEISSFEWAGEVRQGREFDLTKGVVYKTTNGGESWSAVWRGDNLARYIWIDPRDTDVLYVSTGIFDREAANSEPVAGTPGGVGVIKSTDGGATWAQMNNGLDNLYVGTLFMHPEDPDVLLAGATNNQYDAGKGVYLSEDGGNSWRQVSSAIGANSVEFSTLDSDLAYAASAGAVYVSEDRGRTWEQVSGGTLGWGSEGIRAGFPIDLQIDPRDPNRLFANNYGGGNFLSEDGGLTWVGSSDGYTGAQVRDIAASPRFPGEVFAAARSGMFASSDGGLGWEGWNYSPFADLEWNAVAVDPSSDEHVLAANNWHGAILETYDRGRHWRIAAAVPAENFGWYTIAFAPSNPGTVYAGTAAFLSAGVFDLGMAAGGLYASLDGGRSWTERNGSELDDATVTGIAVHPENELVVFVSTAREGVFKTEDGGLSWVHSNNGLPSGAHALSVAIRPDDPNTIFAGFDGSALYRSRDGGSTWSLAATGMNPQATVSDIVPDPTRPGTVYASDRRSGVYRSQDEGESWQLLGGNLEYRDVNRLALSLDGRHLYAATEGAGVFRLDLEGDPPQPAEHLSFFAQFGDGDGFTSDIVLTNPSFGLIATGELRVFDDDGLPLDRVPRLAAGKNEAEAGRFTIMPRGSLTLSTEGADGVAAGSAVVDSSSRVGGTIRFSIPGIGIAGVGESTPLSHFAVPVRHLPRQLSTGLAVQNPEAVPVEFTIRLRNREGVGVATPVARSLPPRGHVAVFIDELFPDATVESFHGVAEVTVVEGLVTATAMELGNTVGRFTTLPVTQVREEAGEASVLNFAQFGNGVGLQSDLVLVNPSLLETVSGHIELFDDFGSALDVTLTGEGLSNPASSDFSIAPLGSATFSTSGEGGLVSGSLRVVTRSGRLGGVIRYDIQGFGIAGVGESPAHPGFIVPVRREGGINTGVAVHNPGNFPIPVYLTLHDQTGQPVENGFAMIEAMSPNGHFARFIDEIFPWLASSEFRGTLAIQAEHGALSATALEQGRTPGQFTTLPVTPYHAPIPEAVPASAAALENAAASPGSISAANPADAPALQGTVLGDDGPLPGARVRVQTREAFTTSGHDGRFEIQLAEGSGPADVTAAAEGHYIGIRRGCRAGDDVVIRLRPHSLLDNEGYQWLPSTGAGGCAECHLSVSAGLELPVDEWLRDAHSRSARNERFLTMYAGTDVHGNRSPPREYGHSPDYGRFPLRPDPGLPYYGPGFKLDYPEQAGNCGACHTPAAAVNHPYETDPRTVGGVAGEGLPCDFCHKIWEVLQDPATGLPFDDRPGVLSFEFRRPPFGRQFFAGPLDDVAPGDDVYSPLQNESRFCAPCHFGVFWGTTVYNSFGEWLESPYSNPDTGRTCQDCHMPSSGNAFFARPDKGGLRRDPSRIFGHYMPGAEDLGLLQQALTLESLARIEAGRLAVDVTIANQNTGHHVPTGSPLRQVILLVEARDQTGNLLEQTEGPTVPASGGVGSSAEGFYAGLPGEIFSKVLREEWTEIEPAVSYWNLTRVVSDNRIGAMERRVNRFAFLPGPARLVTVHVRLLFRRAFIEMAQQKGWSVDDITMGQRSHVLLLVEPELGREGTHDRRLRDIP